MDIEELQRLWIEMKGAEIGWEELCVADPSVFDAREDEVRASIMSARSAFEIAAVEHWPALYAEIVRLREERDTALTDRHDEIVELREENEKLEREIAALKEKEHD